MPVMDNRAIRRLVNRLAWPVILENTFQTALGVVDLALVSRLGANAIAGVGTATQLMWLAIAAFAAVATGTTVLVAQAIGAGGRQGANQATKQSLLMGVAISVVIAVVVSANAERIVAVLGPQPEVVRLGATYLRISAQMSVFFVTMLIAGAALRGAGDTRSPMVVTGGINLINGLLAYALIFGRFGLPALGVAGSAWGAAAARLVGSMALLLILWRGNRPTDIAGLDGWRPNVPLMRRLLGIGLPAMGEQLVISGGFLVYGFMVIGLGTAVYAAQRVSFNAVSISYLPAMGFSIAATTLTGQCLGAGRPEQARRTSNYATLASVIWMSAAGAVLFLFARQIMVLFTPDPQIDAIGAAALKVVALSQPFFGISNALAGSLRGSGDTRFPMVAAVIGMWFVRLPVGWLIGIVLGFGLPGVYVSSVLDAALRSLLIWRRYRTGKHFRRRLA
jgi:putative MATE family efflux protein